MGPNNEEQRQLKVELRLELEFETIDAQLREVMDVEMIRMSEDSLMKPYRIAKD